MKRLSAVTIQLTSMMLHYSNMVRTLKARFLLYLLFLLQSVTVQGQALINNNVTFIQGDSVYVVSAERDTIEIDRKPFSIRYFGKRYNAEQRKFYAASIAVLENIKDIGHLTVGMSTSKTTYLEPGSGMAAASDGYGDTLLVTATGHYYLFYETESEKRVNLISKKANILELEWNISGFDLSETTNRSFSRMKKSTLYFVIFFDRNLDEIIDEGELKVVTVNFKP